MAPGVIHEDPPDHLRSDGKEVHAVPPADPRLVDHAEVRLVHQGRGLQGVAGGHADHPAAGQPPQLLVDQCQQRRGGTAVAVSDGAEQPRDGLRRLAAHPAPNEKTRIP